LIDMIGSDGLAYGDAGVVFMVFGIFLIALALHPFTTYPLSLQLLARWRPRHMRTAPLRQERVALCVCAYNEEEVIRAKVQNMLAMRKAVPGLQILVYVDAASDRTAEILREYADDLCLVVSPARYGKTHGMNMLVGLTDADLVVFSDANVIFAADAIPNLLAPFADSEVGAVCGHLIYSVPGGNATARSGSLYWRLEEHIKALECASGSVMGADGSIFAIRRILHQAPPADLIDDMFVSMSVLCDGRRIVRAVDAQAFEESVSRPAEEFHRKVRIACQAFNVHRALRPRLRSLGLIDRYKYVSHKLLRWFVIYLLAVGSCGFLVGLALVGAPGLAIIILLGGSLALMILMRARYSVIVTIREILKAFLATGIGVWRSLRGDRFQTWSPPTSARSRGFATSSTYNAPDRNHGLTRD
jgi:cellulose synthase/poly-beta-1,6-N-acetylglucosamine synthase-like glycosyltransferase